MFMYLHTYIHTYIHTYRHAYLHNYIYAKPHTCIIPYMHRKHTCIITYIHNYIHTYIHTYIWSRMLNKRRQGTAKVRKQWPVKGSCLVDCLPLGGLRATFFCGFAVLSCCMRHPDIVEGTGAKPTVPVPPRWRSDRKYTK